MRRKLFVWEGFSPDYTEGLAFAIAENETKAKELIIKYHGYNPSDWGTLTIYDLKESRAFAVSGGG